MYLHRGAHRRVLLDERLRHGGKLSQLIFVERGVGEVTGWNGRRMVDPVTVTLAAAGTMWRWRYQERWLSRD